MDRSRSVRLVTTGLDRAGKSVLVSDRAVIPARIALMPGAAFHRMWASDGPIDLPLDDLSSSASAFFPLPGGVRVCFTTLPPGTAELPSDLDVNRALAEVEEKLPGMTKVMERRGHGFHTTQTVDFNLVVNGSVWLELDQAAVMLVPGDCILQCGTRHRWLNRGGVECVIFNVILGANCASESG